MHPSHWKKAQSVVLWQAQPGATLAFAIPFYLSDFFSGRCLSPILADNSCPLGKHRAATSTVFHLQHPQTGHVWLCLSHGLLDLDKQCFSWAFFYRGLSGCLGLSSLNWSESIALKHPRIRTVWSCPITFVPAHQEDMLVQSHWWGHFTSCVMSSPLDEGQEWNGMVTGMIIYS